MSRRLLCFLENQNPGFTGHSVLQWAAFLVDQCNFEACILVWGNTTSIEVPEPLEMIQGFCLDDFPLLTQMPTVNLMDVAKELQKRFSADLVLVPASVLTSHLNVLGAAFSSLGGGDFWFGVSKCELLADGNFACWRTLNNRTLRMVASYPLTLAVQHHIGIPSYTMRRRSLQKLPLSEFSLDADMLHMRAAVFPEPVSILHVPTTKTVQLDEALAFLVSENANP